MSIDDKVPTISAIQLEYDKRTGEYTIFIGIEEGEAVSKYCLTSAPLGQIEVIA